MNTAVEIRIGDEVQTKKQHPCGNDIWTVIRTGADIKIKCRKCGRIVMLDRETFLKRRKKLLKQGAAPETCPSPIELPGKEDMMQ